MTSGLMKNSVLICLILTCLEAGSSTLYIKNYSSKQVKILLEPYEGGASLSKPIILSRIAPAEDATLHINQNDMNGAKIFGISGIISHKHSFYNRCYPLYLNQSYRIIFVESKLFGIVC